MGLRTLDDILFVAVREIACSLFDRRAAVLAGALGPALRTPGTFVAVLAVAIRAILGRG